MDVIGYEEGTLLYIGVEAGQAARVNDIIAIVGKEGTDVSAYVNAEKAGASATAAGSGEATSQAPASASSEQQSVEPLASAESSVEGGRIKASPLAKKLAADKGIDI